MRLTQPARLRLLLDRYAAASLSYPEVGATLGELPMGYRHLDRMTDLGSDSRVFEAASNSLLGWRMHERSGLAVAASGPAAEGQTVVLGAGRPWCLVLPCRVVRVLDEPDRKGFVYGTLPDHPEQGEEAFLIARNAEGRVRFQIRAFSRPGNGWVAATGPLNRWAQALATMRYEAAIRQLSAVT